MTWRGSQVRRNPVPLQDKESDLRLRVSSRELIAIRRVSLVYVQRYYLQVCGDVHEMCRSDATGGQWCGTGDGIRGAQQLAGGRREET